MTVPTVLDQRGDTQRRLLETLLQHPGGRSVDQLVGALDVTANAVRQHLAALRTDGLVHYAAAPATRGRPQHVYQLTEKGQEAFPRRYRELAEVVLEELGAQLGDRDLRRAMRRMGERAAHSLGSAQLPVAATARVMKQLGYEAEAPAPRKGNEEIVARNCVFHQLAKKHAAVCEFDLGFMEAATGRKVEHRECMVRGGTCCRFGFTGKK